MGRKRIGDHGLVALLEQRLVERGERGLGETCTGLRPSQRCAASPMRTSRSGCAEGGGEPGRGFVAGVDAGEAALVHGEFGGRAAMVARQRRRVGHAGEAERQRVVIERDADQRHARDVALPDLAALGVDDEPFAIELRASRRW